MVYLLGRVNKIFNREVGCGFRQIGLQSPAWGDGVGRIDP